MNTEKYNPNYIRKVYQNFEDFNNDICTVHSVKGVINYPLINRDLTIKMKPGSQRMKDYVNITLGRAPDPKAGLSEDIKFYFDDQRKYENITQKELGGGYGHICNDDDGCSACCAGGK